MSKRHVPAASHLQFLPDVTLSQPNLSCPAAIAFSGGGDSTAMIHAFADNPKITHAFIIDHALRDGSAGEVEAAAEFARALGYKVEIDRWRHEGVTSGIQAKARQYRYEALGKMCRRAGIENLITAHTADDQAETLLMRLDRQTGWRGLAGMPGKAYGPLWPALADITLHRPWLDVSREELRDYNRMHRLTFLDDPSNENRDFTRVRARQALSADAELRFDLLTEQKQQRARLLQERSAHADWLSAHAVIHDQNFVTTTSAPPPELLLHILRAVAGTGGPIDRAKRQNLVERMNNSDFKAATLGGAWVVKDNDAFVFTRDMVAVSGRDGHTGANEISVPIDHNMIWDGRFLVQEKQAGVVMDAASGHSRDLRQSSENNHFFDLPAKVRPTVPVFRMGDQILGFGAVETAEFISRSTAARRLHDLYFEQHHRPPATV